MHDCTKSTQDSIFKRSVLSYLSSKVHSLKRERESGRERERKGGREREKLVLKNIINYKMSKLRLKIN